MPLPPDKLKSMFLDLGKATKRGVRKCPNCGTINGTRGLSCKNRDCEYVFKEGGKKTVTSANAVKIVTGSSAQVFSVRLRDRGPDYRGFVQLPLIQDLDGNPAENVDPSILMSVLGSAAKCYVESCSRSKQTNETAPMCAHIRAAIHCSESAQPLTMKNSVLNALQVSPDIKQSIWLLATETTGPLVQRVTKNICVVKCKPSTRHPLGFLHFAFFSASKGKDGVFEHKFQCSCKQKQNKLVGKEKEDEKKRCVHFYACICAFASDDALSLEFSYYINLDKFSEILPELGDTTVIFTDGVVGGEGVVPSTTAQLVSLPDNTVTEVEQLTQAELEVQEEQLEGVDTVLQDHFEEDPDENIVQEGVDIENTITQQDTVLEAEEQQNVIINTETMDDLTPLETVTTVNNVEVIIDNGQINALVDQPPEAKRPKLETLVLSEGSDSSPSNDDGQTWQKAMHRDPHGHLFSSLDKHVYCGACRGKGKGSDKCTVGLPCQICEEQTVLTTETSQNQDITQASNALLTLQEGSTVVSTQQHLVSPEATTVTASTSGSGDYRIVQKTKQTPVKSAPVRNTPKKTAPADENHLYISFHQWLGSVTERINQTMHYQFDGNPDPLVFHAPQVFFECLQARISAGSKKKRLPNSTTGFIRKDALPLGTFTKYTWHITNVLHVKQIFDTPEMSLDITRSFVENKDGTYDVYDKQQKQDNSQFSNDGKNLPIRPFELKTYLKVGHTSPNQKEATPFIIEWIPDILPKSRIGELRIKFEYGHQRNGHVESRPTTMDVSTIHITTM